MRKGRVFKINEEQYQALKKLVEDVGVMDDKSNVPNKLGSNVTPTNFHQEEDDFKYGKPQTSVDFPFTKERRHR